MLHDVAALLEGLEQGQRRAVARLLTLVEDGDATTLRAVVAGLWPRTGHARILGITGPPGVGKSTLTNALTVALRAVDRTVAVLAVDPSSPFTGGALLGDRVRMQGHHDDPGVFIRSMASRGHLGGLSTATPQAVAVLDAAGFDDVIIETVGVGQSEVEVAATADTVLVAMAPGMGDGIQAAKAGILEVADIFVVNKADQSGAGKLEAELRGMLELGHAVGSDGAWWPPIVRTVGVRAEGVDDLVARIDDHTAHLATTGEDVRRRERRALHDVREIALADVRRRFSMLERDGNPTLVSLAVRVARRELTPYAAADEVVVSLGP